MNEAAGGLFVVDLLLPFSEIGQKDILKPNGHLVLCVGP
jgi:hypothetical protein